MAYSASFSNFLYFVCITLFKHWRRIFCSKKLPVLLISVALSTRDLPFSTVLLYQSPSFFYSTLSCFLWYRIACVKQTSVEVYKTNPSQSRLFKDYRMPLLCLFSWDLHGFLAFLQSKTRSLHLLWCSACSILSKGWFCSFFFVLVRKTLGRPCVHTCDDCAANHLRHLVARKQLVLLFDLAHRSLNHLTATWTLVFLHHRLNHVTAT